MKSMKKLTHLPGLNTCEISIKCLYTSDWVKLILRINTQKIRNNHIFGEPSALNEERL